MSEVKLKPCPFCGGQPELCGSDEVEFEDGTSGYWYVNCHTCGGTVFGDQCKEKAAEAWNRRAEGKE